jgi:hypothetical protein
LLVWPRQWLEEHIASTAITSSLSLIESCL